LAVEARHHVRVFRQLPRQDFECQDSIQDGMADFVHHPHTPLAELAEDLVFAGNDYCHRRSRSSPLLPSLGLFRTIGSSWSGGPATFAAFFFTAFYAVPQHIRPRPPSPLLGPSHEFSGVVKDCPQHLPREPASKGVLLAGVVGTEQEDPV